MDLYAAKMIKQKESSLLPDLILTGMLEMDARDPGWSRFLNLNPTKLRDSYIETNSYTVFCTGEFEKILAYICKSYF